MLFFTCTVHTLISEYFVMSEIVKAVLLLYSFKC